MAISNSDKHGKSSGIQICAIHIGPLEYRFLKLVVYAVVGLYLWPYLLLLYTYIAIRLKLLPREFRDEILAEREETETAKWADPIYRRLRAR